MPAVSDTSPILGLSAIGLLELLKNQFETVFIPQAVLHAKKHKEIQSVRSAMELLRQEVGFFISKDLFEHIVKAPGEV